MQFKGYSYINRVAALSTLPFWHITGMAFLTKQSARSCYLAPGVSGTRHCQVLSWRLSKCLADLGPGERAASHLCPFTDLIFNWVPPLRLNKTSEGEELWIVLFRHKIFNNLFWESLLHPLLIKYLRQKQSRFTKRLEKLCLQKYLRLFLALLLWELGLLLLMRN